MQQRDIPATSNSFKRFLIAAFATAVVTGGLSWLFLLVLELVSYQREGKKFYYLLAPVAGLVSGLLYRKAPAAAALGNRLLARLVREPHARSLAKVPSGLALLIMSTTWLAHWVGASVGREGTAAQMGGGVAAAIGRRFGIHSPVTERHLLQVGLACGFGAVFGTPIAGALFALEIGQGLKRERWRERLLEFVFLAVFAFLAHEVTLFLGAKHAIYPAFDWATLLSLAGIGAMAASIVVFALLAEVFLYTVEGFRKLWAKLVKQDYLRPAIGGVLLMTFFFLPTAFHKYAGLGVAGIELSFLEPAKWFDPIAKLALTIYSLGVGFRGGEVTPLFFVGATAGSWVASLFGLVPSAFASLGLVSVFAAATALPLTCAVMASELFGITALGPALLSCYVGSWAASAFTRRPRLYDEI